MNQDIYLIIHLMKLRLEGVRVWGVEVGVSVFVDWDLRRPLSMKVR